MSIGGESGNALVLNKAQKQLTIFQLDKNGDKVSEMLLTNSTKQEILKFKIFGPKKSRILVATKSKALMLYAFDCAKRQSSLLQVINILNENSKVSLETPQILSICPNSKYALLSLSSNGKHSRMIVYDVSKDRIEEVAKKQADHPNMKIITSGNFYGYFNNLLIWSGLISQANSKQSALISFVYDFKKNLVFEVETLRRAVNEGHPEIMQKVEGDLVAAGFYGRFVKLRYYL